MLPSRIDHDVVAGTDVTLEFTIQGFGGPINISNDTVVMAVYEDGGGYPILPKINGPTMHSDPANGKTQFTLTHDDLVTHSFSMQTWRYEVSRVEAGTAKQRVHVAGELRVSPSMLA